MKTFLLLLLLVLIGFAGFTWIKARLNTSRAEAAFPPEGRILEIDGHRVHAVVRGTGPDLVLLHGSSGNARDFTFRLVDRLAGRYRVIAFDRPGLGFSDPISASGASIAQQAAVLAMAAQQLDAEKPIVLGHSYGGAVALAWAVYQPDHISGLVLLSSPSHPWKSALSLRYRALSNPLIGPPMALLTNAYFGEIRYTWREAGALIALTLRTASLRANAMQRANLLDEITAMQPLYGQIVVPVEIVHGTADTTVGLGIHAVPLTRDVPHAHLTKLDSIGHMPQHAAETEVIAAIDRAAKNRATP